MSATKRLTIPAAEEVLNLYYPVLDHGHVALVDYMGGDPAVDEAARTSYGGGTRSTNDSRGLLRYMLRHNHSSPYEQCVLKFHVCLPIFVARQLVRHRTASLNELSLRYSMPSMQFYIPKKEDLGRQSSSNKQGRSTAINSDHADYIISRWEELQEQSVQLYRFMVSPEVDLARELARLHLPVNLYTRWYWSMDLNNLLKFLTLRCDSHAQKEIQEYALIKAALGNRVAPIATEAWVDYHFRAKRFSRQEMQLLRAMLLSYDTSGQSCVSTRLQSLNISALGAAVGMSKREVKEFVECFSSDADDQYDDSFYSSLEGLLTGAITAEEAAARVKKYEVTI